MLFNLLKTGQLARPIIFLHIPKTAGLSIRDYIARSRTKVNICPAGENIHLVGMSIQELRRYDVFAGHLDWAYLDCIGRDPFTFTVLREPTDRILSFYFFLRRDAEKLSSDQLNQPLNQGKKAILQLSPDDYFCKGPPAIRLFLDNHFDNFYTYYFAGRCYDARGRLLDKMRVGLDMTVARIQRCALDNLRLLDGVYRVDDLAPLERDLAAIGLRAGRRGLTQTRVNVGDGDRASRIEALKRLGASERTFARIDEMTALDRVIWEEASLFNRGETAERLQPTTE